MDASELTAALAGNQLAPLWLITGTEPLLMVEAADAIREKARSLGYDDREVLNAAANWDWSQVIDSCQSMSLFGSQKIVELRLNTFRPGKAGSDMLATIADMPLDGVVLVVSLPYDWSLSKASWFKKLAAAATVVQCDVIDSRKLPHWFAARFEAQKQKATPQALKLLSERCEGNLLAGKQELLKLSYQYPEGTEITEEMIADSVSDVSRFDAENLLEATLRGEAVKAARITLSLKSEGIAIPSFLWMLTDELRMAVKARTYRDEGQNEFGALKAAGVYGADRSNRVKAAIKRCSAQKLSNALIVCADIDRLSKGLTVSDRDNDPWIELLSLVTYIAK